MKNLTTLILILFSIVLQAQNNSTEKLVIENFDKISSSSLETFSGGGWTYFPDNIFSIKDAWRPFKIDTIDVEVTAFSEIVPPIYLKGNKVLRIQLPQEGGYLISPERYLFYRDLHKAVIDSTNFTFLSDMVKSYSFFINEVNTSLEELRDQNEQLKVNNTNQGLVTNKFLTSLEIKIEDMEKVLSTQSNTISSIPTKPKNKQTFWKILGGVGAGILGGFILSK